MNETIGNATLGLLIATGLCSWLGFSRAGIRDAWIFSPYQIKERHQYHRLITSGFLHANWTHFGFNAFTLYSFGSNIEAAFGAPFLLAVFFSAILGGNLLSLMIHHNQRNYLALGASGGVCGVVFASIFMMQGSILIIPIPVPIPSYIYAILFPLISIYGISAARDNIGHDAHLGGAIVGLLVATAFYPEIVQTQPLLYATVMAISIGFFIYLARQAARR